MVQAITNYTFVASAKQITLTDYPSIDYARLVLIRNQTTGAYIFKATDTANFGGSVSSNVFTFNVANTGMANGDKLFIRYDNPLIGTPLETEPAIAVRPVPQLTWRTTFARVLAATVDPGFFQLKQTGSGQTVSQSAGNLNMVAGTTANSETVIRSIPYWNDSFNLRYALNLSQRIANNNFFIEMVDVLGDNLAYTINSATSVTVTFPSSPFVTPDHVGHSMYLGIITGAAGVPGRYAIASISGNAVTYTVAGWPATGTGTLSVFGWNYHHIVYNGTTATNNLYDAQKNGWNSGDTTITINTTASPGHMGQLLQDDGTALYSDTLTASTTAPNFVVRGTRFQSLPSATTNLYLQIRSLNGTTAPASSTTMTVNFVSMEDFGALPVAIQGSKALGAGGVPTTIQNSPTVLLTGTTITSQVPGTGATNLGKARATATGTTDTGVLLLGTALSAAPSAATTGTNQPPSMDLLQQLRQISGSATGATVTSVTSSATSVTLLAANTARKGVIFFNNGTTVLSVLLGTGPATTTTALSFNIGVGGYAEIPQFPTYVGIITGIWTGAPTGTLQVTELT